MFAKDFDKAVAEGKDFMMCKYKAFGEWSAPKRVSAEVASRKAKVVVVSYDDFDEPEYHCPYSFELAED